jgi:hypothetical protein
MGRSVAVPPWGADRRCPAKSMNPDDIGAVLNRSALMNTVFIAF